MHLILLCDGIIFFFLIVPSGNPRSQDLPQISKLSVEFKAVRRNKGEVQKITFTCSFHHQLHVTVHTLKGMMPISIFCGGGFVKSTLFMFSFTLSNKYVFSCLVCDVTRLRTRHNVEWRTWQSLRKSVWSNVDHFLNHLLSTGERCRRW